MTACNDRARIARRRAGRGFAYRDTAGRTVRDRRILARIKALAIPPAWTDVWICPDADGHLQATGRDARGRKQYRYHAQWRSRRDDSKFERMLAFARLLPRIRRHCDRDLADQALSRGKVLAAVVRLLELTLIRVGNDEYARLRLANLVRRCQELPGQALFQYLDDDGAPQDITSDDVNGYLRAVAGADVTTRDFRIWSGTVLAYRALCDLQPATTPQEAKRNVLEAIRVAAVGLGNTAAVARRSYVHPAVLDGYLAGNGRVPIPRWRTKGTSKATGPIDMATERRLL